MIDRIKMKPQTTTNFKGLQDPLDPRDAYKNTTTSVSKMRQAEKLRAEALKMNTPKNSGVQLDLKV